jgi:hypothetical protein
MRYLSRYEAVRLQFKSEEFGERLPVFLRRTLVKRGLPDPFANTIPLEGGKVQDFIFIHVPKTAGTSIATFFRVKAKHIPLSRYYLADPARAAGTFKVAFTRDPLERLHSAFNYLRSSIGENNSLDVRWATQHLAGFPDFPAFIEALGDRRQNRPLLAWRHFLPQTVWLVDRPGGDIQIDFLGKFQTLSEDIVRLSKRLGVGIELEHLRKPRRPRGVIAGLQDHHLAIVQEVYRNDYLQLGYQSYGRNGNE